MGGDYGLNYVVDRHSLLTGHLLLSSFPSMRGWIHILHNQDEDWWKFHDSMFFHFGKKVSTITAAWLLPIGKRFPSSIIRDYDLIKSGFHYRGCCIQCTCYVSHPNTQHALCVIVISYVLWGIGIPSLCWSWRISTSVWRCTSCRLVNSSYLFSASWALGRGGHGIMRLCEVFMRFLPTDYHYIPWLVSFRNLGGFQLLWYYGGLASFRSSSLLHRFRI